MHISVSLRGGSGVTILFTVMPKVLFTSPQFREPCPVKRNCCMDLLLDRMQLSMKNRWLDAEGKVYIYFSQEQISGHDGMWLEKGRESVSRA